MALYFRGMTTLNVRTGVKHRVKHYKADTSKTWYKSSAGILHDFESGSNK